MPEPVSPDAEGGDDKLERIRETERRLDAEYEAHPTIGEDVFRLDERLHDVEAQLRTLLGAGR